MVYMGRYGFKKITGDYMSNYIFVILVMFPTFIIADNKSYATTLLEGYTYPLKRTNPYKVLETSKFADTRAWNMGKGQVIGTYNEADVLQKLYVPCISYLRTMMLAARSEKVVLEGQEFVYKGVTEDNRFHVLQIKQ